MRINKLVISVALGLGLLSGVSSTAEAKEKAIVVTVNKADSATAKKVDKALKKGKAVTLKVRGSKKASKNLLIKLQRKVADTLRYGVMFDLDNGNEDYAGKGNKFQTYGDLSYKQSGSYGCYTITKSSANAYKYAFKYIKGGVDEQMKFVKQRYNDYKKTCGKHNNDDIEFIAEMNEFFQDIIDSNWYTINQETEEFFDALLPMYISESLGDIPEGSVDKLAEDAVEAGVDEELVGKLVDKVNKYKIKKAKPAMSIEDFIIQYGYGNDTLKFYKGGSLEPDFSAAKTLTVNALNAGRGMVYGGMEDVINDHPRKMRAYELAHGTDEFRLKSVANNVAQGVCEDYAIVHRTIVDYAGHKSYYVGNDIADHAVCVVSGGDMLIRYDNELVRADYAPYSTPCDKLEEILERHNVSYDGEGVNAIISEYAKLNKEGWDKSTKDAMGKDYPF